VATAASLALRALGGEDPTRLRAEARRLDPTGIATADPTFVWLATLACFHAGGDAWKPWNEALAPALLPTQRAGPPCCLGGSFDAPAGFSLPGGRVEATVLRTLPFHVYYRYDKAVGTR
jgi:hypothetical protein